MDVLSYNQPLLCDCPSPARIIFWAEKHNWKKALQPSLLMSSTENVESPFSFKATANLHASEYALSLLCITQSVWTGPKTSCPPQEGKQGRHILHEVKLLQSRLWWCQSSNPSTKQAWIFPDCSFSPISLLSLETQLPSSLPQGGCQLGLNTSAYLHATFAWNRTSCHQRHRQILDSVGCHLICCSRFSWGRLRAYQPLTSAGITDYIVAV